jgi:hypothetical protein
LKNLSTECNRENDGILYYIIPTVQLFSITWTRVEGFFQNVYPGAEISGFISEGDDVLQIGLSNKSF